MTSPLDGKVSNFGVSVDTLEEFISGEPGEIEAGAGSVPTLRKLVADIKDSALGAVDQEIGDFREAVQQVEQRSADAESAATVAVLAKDAALIQAGVAVDEPTGRAEAADGEAFKVEGTGDAAAYEYRRLNAGASKLLTTYPSLSAVIKAILASVGIRQDLSDIGQVNFVGTGNIVPIVIDSENRALLWVDKEKRGIGGANLLDEASGRAVSAVASALQMAQLSGVEYAGEGDIVPFFMDANNRVVLGFNRATEKIIGAIDVSAGSLVTRSVLDDLLEPPAAAQINHVLAYGQSLSVGAMGQPPLSTTQSYPHLTFSPAGTKASKAGNTFGAVNQGMDALKPLTEDTLASDGASTRGETTSSGTANFFTEIAAVENGVAPDDFVIFGSTAGKGGAAIAELELGAPWFQNVRDHIDGAHALAIAAGKTYAVTAMPYIQGEANISAGSTFAAWREKLAKMQDDVTSYAQSVTGQTAPVYFLLYQTTWGIRANKNIALAQLDLCKKDPHFVMGSPCYHLEFAADLIHLKNIGYLKLSRYFARALKTMVLDKKRPKCVMMKSATVRGSKLSIKYDVPVFPLVLDTVGLALATNFGFKVQDSDGDVGISNITIENGDTVTMTLSRGLANSPVARYAMDYLGAGLAITNGASGNLRDSEPDSFVLSGVTHRCFNVGVHEEMPIIKLA